MSEAASEYDPIGLWRDGVFQVLVMPFLMPPEVP